MARFTLIQQVKESHQVQALCKVVQMGDYEAIGRFSGLYWEKRFLMPLGTNG